MKKIAYPFILASLQFIALGDDDSFRLKPHSCGVEIIRRGDPKKGAGDPDETICVRLRAVPNSMEPEEQPGGVRVDNRRPVRLRIVNVSPLDSCSITRSATPTAETNPFQSLLGTIGGFGPLALGSGLEETLALKAAIDSRYAARVEKLDAVITALTKSALPDPNAASADDEFIKDQIYQSFYNKVQTYPQESKNTLAAINEAQKSFESASVDLLNVLAKDYRGRSWKNFKIQGNNGLTSVVDLIDNPIRIAIRIGENQGDLDALSDMAAMLHKKYIDDTSKLKRKYLDTVALIDKRLATIKASISLMTDGAGNLKNTQNALRQAYLAAAKLETDFKRREEQGIIVESQNKNEDVLYQDLNMGTDRKDTVTGTVNCVSQVDSKTPTADPINYSILYQDIPAFSVSAGILATAQDKYVLGIKDIATTDEKGSKQVFGLTDSGSWQVFPTAFVSYRPLPFNAYWKLKYGRTREDRILISGAITGGIGVNSNNGNNQVEFFVGPSVTLNKVVISLGLHRGRMQSLGGGFVIGGNVPSDVKTAPINYAYHSAFSIGLSYRIAPW